MATTESINVRDSYEITDEMRENIDNPFYDLDGVNSFTFINNEKMTQSALALIYNALYGLENQDKIPELEEAYRNAQADLVPYEEKVKKMQDTFSAFQAILNKISSHCNEYEKLNKGFNSIVNFILYGQTDGNGNPIKDESGNVISGGLIAIGNEFDKNMKDIGLVDPNLSSFQSALQGFANVLNGITLDALSDPTPTQNGKSTQGQDKLNALLDAFNVYYKAACGVDGELNNILNGLIGEDAALRTNLLYTLATKTSNEDFCELEEKENLSTVGGVLLGKNASFTEGRSIVLNSDAITEIVELLTIANAGWTTIVHNSYPSPTSETGYLEHGGDENGHWDGSRYYFNLPGGGTGVFDRRGMNPEKGGYEFSSEDIEKYLQLITDDKLKKAITDADIEEISTPVLNADGSQKMDASGNPVTETKYKYVGQWQGSERQNRIPPSVRYYSLDKEFDSKEACLNYVIGEVKKSEHAQTVKEVWQRAVENGTVSETPAICDDLFLKFQNMTSGSINPTSSSPFARGPYGRDIAVGSGADFDQNPYAYKVTEIRKEILQSWKDLGQNLPGTSKSGYEFAESRLETGYIQLIYDMQETAQKIESRFYANSSSISIDGVTLARPNKNPDDKNLWDADGLIALYSQYIDVPNAVQALITGEETGVSLRSIVEEAYNRTSDSVYDKNTVFSWDQSKSALENMQNLETYISSKAEYASGKLTESNNEYGRQMNVVNELKDGYYRVLNSRVDDLLNFAIRYNPYDGEGEKITQIFLNEDGTYSINEPKAASNGSARAQTASMSNEAAPASYSLYSTNAMTAPYSLNSEDFGEDDTETIATQTATSRMLNMARSAATPATYSLNSDENVDVSLLSDSPDLANTPATLSSVDSIPQVRASSAANMQDSLENKALPYYVLAVCLTFARGVQDQMTLKIGGTEEKNDGTISGINNLIKENNRYLRWLNSLYDQYYTKCSSKSGKNSFQSSSVVVDGLTSSQVETYVNGTCGYKFSCGDFEYGKYNNMGDEGTSETANIDVEEQRNLTKISNAQEAVRMRGDELNTMSQMATTQLQNLTQKYNTFISVCSQLAKSTGDYFKTIAGNIR